MPKLLGIENGESGRDEFPNLFSQVSTRKRTYVVEADNFDDTQETIQSTPGVPQRGDVIGGLVFLKSREPQQDQHNPFLWRIVCEFDNRADGEVDPAPEPWLRLPEWEWGGTTIEQVIEQDPVQGFPIVNAVNEPIVMTGPMPIPELTITRFQLAFDANELLNYVGRTNSAPFWGAPAKTALMMPIRDRPANIEGYRLRRVTYQIQFNFTYDDAGDILVGWQFHTLHKGTKYLQTAGDDIDDAVPFLDAQGHRTTGLLDSDGTQLTAAQINVRGSANYLTYNRHRTADFNQLMLGPWG